MLVGGGGGEGGAGGGGGGGGGVGGGGGGEVDTSDYTINSQHTRHSAPSSREQMPGKAKGGSVCHRSAARKAQKKTNNTPRQSEEKKC